MPIQDSIDLIHNIIGVRAEVSCDDLIEAANGADREACVRLAVQKMNLQTNINVIERRPKFDEPLGEISLPEHSMIYGTDAWKHYSFNMIIRADLYSPYRYLFIVLHELAHVLLYGIAPKHCHEEQIVDLTVLALGFNKIVRYGRTGGIGVAGYLSEDEYLSALSYLERLQTPISSVVEKFRTLRVDIVIALELIAQCRRRLGKIYKYKPRMDFNSAAKISMLCGCDGLQQMELNLNLLKNRIETIEKWVSSAPSTPIAQFKERIRPLDDLHRKISDIENALKTDEAFLRNLEPGMLTKLVLNLTHSFKHLLPGDVVGGP